MRYGAALSTVRELEFQDMRAMRLREIAVAQAKAGQPDQAREIFAEMLATALGIKEGSQPDKAKPIYDVAVSQAEAGLTTEALETARQIDDDTKFRISALCRIAAVQAKANEAEQARRTVSEAIGIARKIKGASERLSALSEIGRTQAEAGQSEHACRTLAEAIALARAIKAGDVSLLVALASAQADCGQTEPARKTTTEAVAIARRMSDEDRLSRAYVIAEIALAQARAGFLTEALATADEIQAASVLMQNFRGNAIGDAFSVKMATLRQIGAVYAQKRNFSEALEYGAKDRRTAMAGLGRVRDWRDATDCRAARAGPPDLCRGPRHGPRSDSQAGQGQRSIFRFQHHRRCPDSDRTICRRDRRGPLA